MLAGLAILRDTSLELTGTTSNDEDGAVSLGGTSDHVLDEVTVSGGIDDLGKARENVRKRVGERSTYGDHVLGGLELPEGDIDGDTTLTLGLELVKNPGYEDEG